MGHIYLSHSHPITIYACPILSHPMGRFPWDSYGNDIPIGQACFFVFTICCIGPYHLAK